MNQLFRECQVRITSIALLHETPQPFERSPHIKMGDYTRPLTGHLFFLRNGVDPGSISLTLNRDEPMSNLISTPV